MIMTAIELTAPPIEPVDLTLAKTFLRVDHEDEDELISSLIISARQRIEKLLGRVLITRRFELTLPISLGPLIPIKPVPVVSVISVTVSDDAQAIATVDPTRYRLETRREPAELSLRIGESWDADLPGASDLTITFDAGYGAEASDVPMPIRQAILLVLAQSHAHRGPGDPPPLPLMVDALLMPYRWYKL